MVRRCGAVLGIFAFAVTIFLGLAAGNPVEETIKRAVTAMVIFCAIGFGVGWVAYRVLEEHALRKHREMFPDELEGDEPTASDESEKQEARSEPVTGANLADAGQ